MAGKPIGEYLKEKGLITQEQLEMVLEKQRESNGLLVSSSQIS